MSKLVIMFTGSIHTPTMSPIMAIADAAIGAAEAVPRLLHARHPENGRPDYRPETFLNFCPGSKRVRCGNQYLNRRRHGDDH